MRSPRCNPPHGSGQRLLGIALIIAISSFGLSACSTGHGIEGVNIPANKARLDVAKTAEESGHPGIALSMYAAAAKASPDNAGLQSRYVAALIQARHPQQAEYVLDRALERQPKNQSLLVERGNLQLSMGDAAGAITIFNGVLAHHPDNLGALNGRGVGFDLLGQYEDAQKNFNAVLRSHPNNVPAANNLALSLMLQGRAAEAVPILSSLAQQDSVPPRVLNNLGLAEAAAGHQGAANRILSGRIDEADVRAITLNLSPPIKATGTGDGSPGTAGTAPPHTAHKPSVPEKPVQ